MSGRVALVGVYFSRKAERVQAVAGPALVRGWTVACGVLEERAGDLAPLTVRSGAGPRLALLNEAVRRAGDHDRVGESDDVTVERDDVVRLVSLAERAARIDRVHAELELLGHRAWSDVQVTPGTWRPWQRSPGRACTGARA